MLQGLHGVNPVLCNPFRFSKFSRCGELIGDVAKFFKRYVGSPQKSPQLWSVRVSRSSVAVYLEPFSGLILKGFFGAVEG